MNFPQLLDRFYRDNPDRRSSVKSRAQEKLPRIRVERAGRFTYLQGLPALARHTRRPVELVREYLIHATGCVVQESTPTREVIRGQIAIKKIRQFEKKYLESIMCRRCGSPQTESRDGAMHCSGCGVTGINSSA